MRKTKKILRVSLLFVGLLGIGSLVYAGFAPMTGQDLTTRIQQEPLSLEVPVIQQYLTTSWGKRRL